MFVAGADDHERLVLDHKKTHAPGIRLEVRRGDRPGRLAVLYRTAPSRTSDTSSRSSRPPTRSKTTAACRGRPRAATTASCTSSIHPSPLPDLQPDPGRRPAPALTLLQQGPPAARGVGRGARSCSRSTTRGPAACCVVRPGAAAPRPAARRELRPACSRAAAGCSGIAPTAEDRLAPDRAHPHELRARHPCPATGRTRLRARRGPAGTRPARRRRSAARPPSAAPRTSTTRCTSPGPSWSPPTSTSGPS